MLLGAANDKLALRQFRQQVPGTWNPDDLQPPYDAVVELLLPDGAEKKSPPAQAAKVVAMYKATLVPEKFLTFIELADLELEAARRTETEAYKLFAPVFARAWRRWQWHS